MSSTRYYAGYAAYALILAAIAFVINKEVTVPYMVRVALGH